MRHALVLSLTSAVLLTTAGCASPDHVLFVTKTSIGIDFDSKPAAASLAYDRTEGYVAPRYANGEIPPVVASVRSNGAVFSPKVKQVYATGDAAVIAVGGQATASSQAMQGERKLMFFGTTTTTGVKVGFTTSLPDSFTFGFRRKEFSYIPLASVAAGGETHDVYPSVLASIDTAADVAADGTVSDTALTNAQFFATGAAARRLAQNPDISGTFQTIANESITRQQLAAVTRAGGEMDIVEALLDDVRKRFHDTRTTPSQKAAIVDAAKALGLDPDNSMTAANFDKKVTQFAGEAPHEKAREKLKALRSKIDALLAR